jgi:hypothetical protein
MSASPRTKRNSPSNKFEDYVLTYTVGQGLYPVSTFNMSYLSVASGTGAPYSIGNEILDIGFTFKFDGRNYDKIYVSTYGFAILVDPSADPGYVTDATMDDPSDNSSIIMSAWSDAHVVLSPWWDSGVRSVFRYTSDSGASSYLSSLGLISKNVELGISLAPAGLDSSAGGIKKFSGFDDRDGRFFMLRWKVFTNVSGGYFNVASYDVVLYESGIIEFRYSPRSYNGNDLESASIGMFACINSSNRYRDFSHVLRKDSRGQYKNGGSIYNGAYSDSDGTNTSNYTISLDMKKDWPGLDRGATFRMTPPRNKRRQTRKTLNDRNSTSFIKNGMFNDQKTVNFSKQKIQYPAMIPVDYVTSMNDIESISIVELYSSGSIEVDMNLSSGLFDDAMVDSIAERGKK